MNVTTLDVETSYHRKYDDTVSSPFEGDILVSVGYKVNDKPCEYLCFNHNHQKPTKDAKQIFLDPTFGFQHDAPKMKCWGLSETCFGQVLSRWSFCLRAEQSFKVSNKFSKSQQIFIVHGPSES